MDEMNPRSEDTHESDEGRIPEQESLDDAAFEPLSHIEQTGDFHQAESVQNSIVELIDNILPGGEQIPAAAHGAPGDASLGDGIQTGGEGGGERITPADLPEERRPAAEGVNREPGTEEPAEEGKADEDLAELRNLRLQTAMNKKQQSEQARSDIKKKSDDTRKDIIGNLK